VEREITREHSLKPPKSFSRIPTPESQYECVDVDINSVETNDPIGLVIQSTEMDRTLECALEALGLDRPLVKIAPHPHRRPQATPTDMTANFHLVP